MRKIQQRKTKASEYELLKAAEKHTINCFIAAASSLVLVAPLYFLMIGIALSGKILFFAATVFCAWLVSTVLIFLSLTYFRFALRFPTTLSNKVKERFFIFLFVAIVFIMIFAGYLFGVLKN